jgi:hypothetical protein
MELDEQPNKMIVPNIGDLVLYTNPYTNFAIGVLGVVVNIDFVPAARVLGDIRLDVLIKLSCGDTIYAGPEDLVIASESR